ncbi:Succinate dehydrogenase assembly factor 1, mitochondrial [Cyphellophora attinorum]|uniref:Succinate dehydrogenase assembly factor 1, mitochondrial n=1 Tax=Cyphellophora attinorum TaxID=1664694 RepID=A0A0N1P2E2_9EURO|nr:Succinate dehydrogenase assembly factor 1, mitochondrial [Phialophora attinorum]KPI45723.1 Succinate dehydrogenase assembly factor 1, mitochondrial [Phialophora attinorum]
MVKRLSGLQKEVIKLYRHCLREAGKKPEKARPHFRAVTRFVCQIATVPQTLLKMIRREFHKNQSVDKKDFATIETLLRMGYRKLELYSEPSITDIH